MPTTEIVTLRDKKDSTKILHPETEAAAVVTDAQGGNLSKVLDSVASYTPGSTGGVSTDMLAAYYNKSQVDGLLAEKQDKPSEGSFPVYLDLSKEADYQLFQGIMAGYNWGWTSLNPPALSTISQIQGSFGTQAQVFEIGKTYLALFSGYDTDGLRASVFTVNSGGTSVTWDASKRWEIPIGAHVVMPNGAVYLAVAKPTASNTPIYECVKPISGKIPIEIDTSYRALTLSNLINCDVKLSLGAYDGNIAHFSITNVKNSTLVFDFTNYSYTNETSGQRAFELEFKEDNAQVIGNPIYLGDNSSKTTPAAGNFVFFSNASGADWQQGSYRLQFTEWGRATHDADGNLISAWFKFFIRNCVDWTPKEGYEIQLRTLKLYMDPSGNFTYSYKTQIKATETAAVQTAMRAKAMSSEPELTQEEFNEAIKGKSGIFTIKDGKVYDLLTGEYVD